MTKRHLINYSFPKGEFRVVCSKCGKVFVQEQGNLLKAALIAESFSDKCDVCMGDVILETNPEDEKPKYDKDHQYPYSSNY